MKIAVCDDEPLFSERILDYIRHNLTPGDDFDVSVFDSGGKLLGAYRDPHPFNIILLDIKMPGINGIDAAKEIRKYDKDVVIIIITSFKEFVFQSFEIRAFNYLLKPITLEKFSKVFRSAVEICHAQRESTFVIDTKERSDVVPLNEIIYFESFRRVLTICTTGGCYRCYKRISDVAATLPKRDFYMVHKSCVIGLRYVLSVEKAERIVRLKGGNTQTVSRRRIDGLMLALMEHGRVKL